MNRKIIILGTGGNCIDILDLIGERNKIRRTYECIGFLDDNLENHGRVFYGVKVVGSLADAHRFPDCLFVNGIGSASNFWRKNDIIKKTGIPRERFATLIHPSASVSGLSRIGCGTVIFQNATITSMVEIGHHVVVLPNSVISHNCVIGDYTCIAGSACVSGNVHIGGSCYLGAHASVKNDIRIGQRSLIGMGAVVIRDVAENSVMVGNPARFLRQTIPDGRPGD